MQVDAAGGLPFFLGKGRDETQRRQFFEEWLARDPRAAVDGLLAGGAGWEAMARECLTQIARVAPDRVFFQLEEDLGAGGKPKLTERVVELHAGENVGQ